MKLLSRIQIVASLFLVFLITFPGYTESIQIAISSSSDDAEESSTGSVSLSSSDLELTEDGGVQTVGMRFTDINLPQGAVISRAYVQFQVDETSSASTQLLIEGEATDNPLTFTSSNNNISNRQRTSANVSWTPVAWPATNARGSDQQTPDLRSIVQELVGRSGWSAGQAMVFIVSGTGERTAESFNGDAAAAPTLHIEYSIDGNPAPVASFNATPTNGNSPLLVSFDASNATDNGSITRYNWDFGDGNQAADSSATVEHSYATPGNYTATLTVTDNEDKSSTAEQVITVTDSNAPSVLEIAINSGDDDAEESSTGSVSLGSSDLELTEDGGVQTVGMRFTSINLPQGAVISRAYVQFQVDETSSASTQLRIEGEAADNPSTFISSNNNISNRLRTNANVSWTPVAWPATNARGSDQQTPDLRSIVQELVGRSGWSAGQAMVFIVSGTGERTAESFNGDAAAAPTLHIEFSIDGNPAPVASFNATPTSGNSPLLVSFDARNSTDNDSITRYDWDFGDGNQAADSSATVTHSYTTLGNYTATLTVTDNENKSSTAEQVITVTDSNAPSVLEIAINSGDDDAEESSTGSMSLGSSDLELTEDGGVQTVGMRFTDINLPQGAVISRAYVQFQVDETSSVSTQLLIEGEATDNPLTFTSSNNNISNRPRTSANVNWTPAAWPATDARGTDQQTPDLRSIVQEMVGRSGWNAGQAMVFIVSGTGERTAESFNGDVAAAPTLHIEYSVDSSADHIAPTITLNGSNPQIVELGDEYIEAGATATDETDGDLTEQINISGSVNMDLPGDHIITYSVSDASNNYTEVQRVVTVRAPASTDTIVVNEILVANTVTNYDPTFKEFSAWIELYNSTDEEVDIGGYYLSDDASVADKWRVPSGTTILANSYLLIWADGEDTGLHTNFGLDSDGEELLLSDDTGVRLATLEFPEQKSDISFGVSNGSLYYMLPTPGRANGVLHATADLSEKPEYSLASGFYDNPQTLSLTQANNADIYYTTDGSTPSLSSTKFTLPIAIDETTVIRAFSLEEGGLPSKMVTATYFIDESLSLPVVSITLDDEYLYDNEIGIYENYDENWTRTGTVEYFQDGESKFSQLAGFKIHGNNTRRYDQKSFAVYAKKKYGEKSIKYPLFRDKPLIDKVKSFVLRNGGTEWDGARSMIGDAVQQGIVKDHMDIDYQSYHPSVVFLNGKYWGIHNIREKLNEDYIEANHGIDSKEVDILENDAELSEGTDTAYVALKAFLNSNDLSDDSAYAEAASQIDVVELMNHAIVQSFVRNTSIGHNLKYWRQQINEGKWRWMLFDLDRGFRSTSSSVLSLVMDDIPTNIVFHNMMKNDGFKNAFASRYFTHLNLTFQTDRMDGIIESLQAEIVSEIPRHFQKWTTNSDGGELSFSSWSERIDQLLSFSDRRPDLVRATLRDELDLSGANDLHVFTAANGKVFVDDVELTESYTGEYFDNAEVALTAKPDNGYKFVRWSTGDVISTLNVLLNTDKSISALFEVDTQLEAIVINEIMATADSGLADSDGDFSDWIELYNEGEVDVDLQGWCLSDNATSPEKWCFSTSIILPVGEYLLVFASEKNINQAGSELHTNFKLSKDGEYLGLRRDDETVSHEFSPQFPEQNENISYGKKLDGSFGYFQNSTPNMLNSE
ncbi:MAG: Unknown protein [uncultured Thiotrichaceae bacterium]|uniref:Uncharacterized protein n=1 Tax=uncultured Thiotrichaceae bacterium TaxID=298394 RepID=A0A6S6TW95_9GAMM|nr:MAG: Unknown protein [uncultured Thiotrichaceae bacterium]